VSLLRISANRAYATGCLMSPGPQTVLAELHRRIAGKV
jgi:hypothetical protein